MKFYIFIKITILRSKDIMTNKSTSLILGFVLLFFACGEESATSNLSKRSLLQYGIPLNIMTPDSVEVEVSDLMVYKDVTIKGATDEKFDIQIFASEATTSQPETVKNNLLTDVKANPYFSEIVKDEPTGFIYKTMVDSSSINYGFRRFQLEGDREYIFQTGMMGRFTLEEVEEMYEAVKPVE